MPLTYVYEPGKNNGSDNNDVDDDDDIVPTPGSDIEEPKLALPPSNCRACRCNLEKYLTEPSIEE